MPYERNLKNTSNKEAKENGWEIVKPLEMEVIGKAVYEYNMPGETKISIMKSTKRFKVDGGWMYNTSTEIHKGNKVSVAEALAFVPNLG